MGAAPSLKAKPQPRQSQGSAFQAGAKVAMGNPPRNSSPPAGSKSKSKSANPKADPNPDPYNLSQRFCKKQKEDFDIALKEIRAGRKESCWSWWIFPVEP